MLSQTGILTIGTIATKVYFDSGVSCLVLSFLGLVFSFGFDLSCLGFVLADRFFFCLWLLSVVFFVVFFCYHFCPLSCLRICLLFSMDAVCVFFVSPFVFLLVLRLCFYLCLLQSLTFMSLYLCLLLPLSFVIIVVVFWSMMFLLAFVFVVYRLRPRSLFYF